MEKLLLLTTGGTLDKVYFDALSEFQVGEPVAPNILKAMNVNFKCEHKEICRKDSLELTGQDRLVLKSLIDASDAKYVLITHGTDTMVDSANYIGKHSDKVIIFTGAMQPAAFTSTDAVFNIGTAVGAFNFARPGSYIAMSGQVYPATNVYKNYETKRFEGM
ncbi:MAG: L-asparaginase [Bermanella sp.]|jgi:L-asparaginase